MLPAGVSCVSFRCGWTHILQQQQQQQQQQQPGLCLVCRVLHRERSTKRKIENNNKTDFGEK